MRTPRQQIEAAKREARKAGAKVEPDGPVTPSGVRPPEFDSPEQQRFRTARKRMRIHAETVRYVFGGAAMLEEARAAIEADETTTIIIYRTRR